MSKWLCRGRHCGRFGYQVIKMNILLSPIFQGLYEFMNIDLKPEYKYNDQAVRRERSVAK